MKDCKEFQGELFGICNLFSDLSDKLFTSEIIEMHEGRETKEGHAPNPNQNISKAGSSVIFKETDAVGSIETRKPTHPGKTATIKPTLEDLGKIRAYFIGIFGRRHKHEVWSCFINLLSLLRDMQFL